MTNFIDFTEFNPANLTGIPTEQKEVKGTTQKYFNVTMEYTHEGIVMPFCVQLCKAISYAGITVSINTMSNKKETQVKINFTPDSADYKAFVATWMRMYAAASAIVYEHRIKIKLPHHTTASEALFKNPLYFPRDEQGNIKEGSSPTLFTKVSNMIQRPTTFRSITGARLTHDILSNVRMEFIPLLDLSRIYIGQKASWQVGLVSGLVIMVVSPERLDAQASTRQKLLEQNPELADKFIEQMRDLEESRKENLTLSALKMHEKEMEQKESDTQSITPSQHEGMLQFLK